ncbi:MAG: hypothetical protein KGL48_05945 [Sphingomonadales bacterium]|nr:hypothetical protein [Sphingomonadales bacterium]MDE2569953.1 hypothetical protein [Sphingomonadales bacterium]
MLSTLLAAAALSASPAIARADTLNEAYWNCMFATARKVREQQTPGDRVPTMLDNACKAERVALRDAFVAVQLEHGMSIDDAVASWTDLDARGRNRIERTFLLPPN